MWTLVTEAELWPSWEEQYRCCGHPKVTLKSSENTHGILHRKASFQNMRKRQTFLLKISQEGTDMFFIKQNVPKYNKLLSSPSNSSSEHQLLFTILSCAMVM
jgi:hypothetical protein